MDICHTYGKWKIHIQFLSENLKRRDQFWDLNVDRRILLKWILLKYIVTCIPIARQRLGKHASTIKRLLSMWSAPRPLLCNGAVNTPKTIRGNRRRRFPWGPFRVIITKNWIEQYEAKGRASRRQPAGIWGLGTEELNGVESSEFAATEWWRERN
jgi:hypothetical protein